MAKEFFEKTEKPTPVEEQIKFLKNIIFDTDEYEKLLDDPEGYCSGIKPRMNLDSEVVKKVERVVFYDEPIDEEIHFTRGGGDELEKLRKKIDSFQKIRVLTPQEKLAGSFYGIGEGDETYPYIIAIKINPGTPLKGLIAKLEKVEFKKELKTEILKELNLIKQ